MDLLLAYLPTNIWTLFLSGLIFILAVIFIFQIKKTEYLLYFLLLWFPLENLFLRYAPIDYYSYLKYFPEAILYSLFVGAWAGYIIKNKKFFPPSPLNKWLLAILLTAILSLIFNWYSPVVWVFGLRQLFRFLAVFFLILFLAYPLPTLKKFLYFGGAMIFLQAVLGLVQYLFGGSLDKYLFSSPVVSIGNLAILGGIDQNWTPGTRIFATMGRYDQLGSFLALGLGLFFPWLYFLKKSQHRLYLGIGLLVGALALLLTASRASWLGALLAILIVGGFLLRDRRVWLTVGIVGAVLVVYLLGFAIAEENLGAMRDKPNQSFQERFFTAVSLRAWRNSYDGFGRTFFIINTPLRVVPSAPLFGVGPGNYGGGVAAALLNTKVYDRLLLPFGIQNRYGQIDNSWFSFWGEFGTVGLVCLLGLFTVLIRQGKKLFQHSREGFSRGLGLSLVGATVVVMVVGFFGPYFEFRSLMFYYWLLAGVVMTYSNNSF